MARARNIKPAFFDNEDLAELPALNRLLFIGLWCLADREGRVELRPKRIKAQLFPYDNCDMIEMVNSLSVYKFIEIYTVEDKEYLQINKWAKHQNPHHKEIASILPAPLNHKDTVCAGYIAMNNTIRNRTYDRCGRVCACCGAVENLEVDHKMPISKGGNSIDDNLQILCKRCNVKKFNNYIDFSKLPVDKSSMVQAWFKHGSSITQEQFNEIASCHTDSLNLIPDCGYPITDSPILNPDTPIPESVAKASQKSIDFSMFNMTKDDISEVRRIRTKNKGGALTQRIVNALAKEFNAGGQLGYSLDDMLTEWEVRGWKSFKAEWMKGYSNSNNTPSATRKDDNLNKALNDMGISKLNVTAPHSSNQVIEINPIEQLSEFKN